ncbi:unnamed protein product, partial [Ascophyllum nodosum]
MESVRYLSEEVAVDPVSDEQRLPSVIMELKNEGSRSDCFLLGYTSRSSASFAELVVVTASAVYKGGTSCVEKPAAKKKLGNEEHLSRVLATVLAASSMASADGVSGSPSDNRATAALTLKLTNEEAVVEVKEALKGGSSFVLLAIIRLPIINEAAIPTGLLLEVVRAAHRRGHEAEKTRRELEKVRLEQTRFKQLLDSAVRDKRKVVQKILERAALVVNAKKVMIANLQDQESDDEGSGGEGWDGVDNDGVPAGTGDNEADQAIRPAEPKRTSERLSRVSMSSPSRAGKILRSPDSAARVVPGAVRKSPARGRGGKLKLEPDIDLVSSLKEGGDPLSVPLGTQEVSGGDLLRQFAGKRGHGGGVACDVDAWDGEKDEEGGDALGNKGGSVKRHRASPPSSISRSSHPARSDVDMDDTCDDVDDGSSTNEALKLVHDDSSDSDGGRGAIGRVGAPRRRRRVQKPKSATRALEEGGDSGGRKEAKGNMDASTSFSVSNINHRGGAKTSEQYRGIKVKTSGSRGNGSRRIQEVVLNFVLGHGCLGDLSRIDVVDTIESIPSHAITMCYLFMCHV